MNYAEEMLARQKMLWQRICAFFPPEMEEETAQWSGDRQGAAEERRSARALYASDASDAAQAEEAAAGAELMREVARRAAYLAAQELWHGTVRRGREDEEADALMQTLFSESARRSAAYEPPFTDGAAETEGVHPMPSAQGQAAALYGAPREIGQQVRMQETSAQEISRCFERDSRRYDAAFTRYE